MKVLQIDREFTKQYINDLEIFLRQLLKRSGHLHSYDGSLQMAVNKLQEQVIIVKKQLSKKVGNNVNFDITIDPNIAMELDNSLLHKHTDTTFYLCVGGKLAIREGVLVTQSITLTIFYKNEVQLEADRAGSWKCPQFEIGCHVLRRFHFDIDKTLAEGKWPLSHLQYGGNFEEQHFPYFDNMFYQLFGPLDVPRLPNPPYSLILCLDIFLRAIETANSNITKERFWVESVQRAEVRWLLPYYKEMTNFLEDNARKGTVYDRYSERYTE